MSERTMQVIEKRVGTHLKFMMVEDEDYPDGVELAVFRDVSTVPRDFDAVLLNTFRYTVMEQGVLWTFTENGAFVTVVLVPFEEEAE